MCKKPWSSPISRKKCSFLGTVFQAENRELRKKLVETLRKGAGSAEPSPWFLGGFGVPLWGRNPSLDL